MSEIPGMELGKEGIVGKRLNGILNRINKRGTVLVKSDKGQFVDKAGNRYLKYYVPFTLLRE